MKSVKKLFILFIIILFLPIFVRAGSLRFNTPEKLSNTSYRFTLTIQDIDLNYISGKISITNGTISNIVMSNGWVSQTGNNNSFYFYRNGVSTGNYIVATIYVTMTGNSEYSISDIQYGVNKCTKNIYGTYFGDTGNVVNQSTFNSVCGVSKDATLKSLSLSSGTLSPSFSPSLELYSTTVDNSISAISFYPVVNNSKAKVISGTNCALKVGVNFCKLVVQAESGDTKTYSITVTRKGNTSNSNSLSNDASIKNLKVNGGTLTSAFSSTKTEYDVKVAKNISQLTFSFVMNSNGQSLTSDSCPINSDTTRCRLTITAEDGISTKTYTFNILHEDNNSSANNNSNTNSNANNGNETNKPSDSSNSSIQHDSSSTINSSGDNHKTDVIIEPGDKIQNEITENENTFYSKNPEEMDTITIPVIEKEMNADNFYRITTIVVLILGVGVGFILSKVLKKIIKK